MSDDPPPKNFNYGERLEDGQFERYPTIDGGDFQQEPRRSYIHDEEEGGCGKTTRMSPDLMKSVARNPEYYIKTYCEGCQEHVPVEEVRWLDGEKWVVNDEQSVDTEIDGGRSNG